MYQLQLDDRWPDLSQLVLIGVDLYDTRVAQVQDGPGIILSPSVVTNEDHIMAYTVKTDYVAVTTPAFIYLGGGHRV